MAKEKNKKIILIVEDEAPLRRTIGMAFQIAGFDTREAHNGKEGLASMIADCPDLVILDMVMPVMDGMTMLTEMRGNDICKNLPVIIFTNLTENEVRTKALALGTEDCFGKTEHSLSDLVTRAKEILGA